jgi:rhodanese-related sulfurtransferase
MKYEDLPAHQVPEFLTRPEAVVLDIRDANSFSQDHIEGAQPASEQVIGRLLRRRQQQPPILVYCYHGHSSRDMASFLGGLGFNNVYNLEGGWQAWLTFVETSRTAFSQELTHWLTQAGFDPGNINSRIDNGMSALMLAALQDEAGIVQALLAAGADVNLVNDDDNNALWFACVSENIEIIELLVAHQISLDNQNANGATCLIYAASAGKLDVVKALVELGADLDKSTLDGFSALDSAATLPILQFLKPHYAAA